MGRIFTSRKAQEERLMVMFDALRGLVNFLTRNRLTLRDRFAMGAPTGPYDRDYMEAAVHAYSHADAMLEVRKGVDVAPPTPVGPPAEEVRKGGGRR